MKRNSCVRHLVWRTEVLWDQTCCWEPPAETWRCHLLPPLMRMILPASDSLSYPNQSSYSETQLWDRKGDISAPKNCCINTFNRACHVVSVYSTRVESSSISTAHSILWENIQICHPFFPKCFWQQFSKLLGILMLTSEILILLVWSVA